MCCGVTTNIYIQQSGRTFSAFFFFAFGCVDENHRKRCSAASESWRLLFHVKWCLRRTGTVIAAIHFESWTSHNWVVNAADWKRTLTEPSDEQYQHQIAVAWCITLCPYSSATRSNIHSIIAMIEIHSGEWTAHFKMCISDVYSSLVKYFIEDLIYIHVQWSFERSVHFNMFSS